MDQQEFWDDFQHLKREATKLRSSEARLKQIRSRYAAVMEAPGRLIAVLDREGTLLEVNPAGLELLGRDAAELVGKRVVDVFEGARERVIGERAAQVIAQSQAARFRWELAQLQGPVRRFSVAMEPIRSEQGDVDAALLVAEELTELLGLDEELARFGEQIERMRTRMAAELKRREKN